MRNARSQAVKLGNEYPRSACGHNSISGHSMIKTAQVLAEDGPRLNLTAVCISRTPETFDLPNIPFCNYTEGWKPFQHERTKERVEYLAERRNIAVSQALSLYPETEHILMIDSYYIHENDQIKGLIQDYFEMSLEKHIEGCILGASTWFFDLRRIRARWRFYDSWTTPEGSLLELSEAVRAGGIIEVKAVGACYIYPRWVWEKNRYDVLEDLRGCEHNWLCEQSGLPVYLSLSRRLSRGPVRYPWLKRIRVSLHLGRFVRR
jgi:hypothetical protein